MTSFKFAANLSTMFKEIKGVPERYVAAKQNGFHFVEMQFPYEYALEELTKARADTDLQHILINSPPGNTSKGELGIALYRSRRKEFETSVDTAIAYGKGLKCKYIHFMSGKTNMFEHDICRATYVKNLRMAAEKCQQAGIIAVIEALNPVNVPHYVIPDYKTAEKIVREEVNHPNLKLLLDVFHLQMSEGNITNTITRLMPITAHIQVSQAPNRDEPWSHRNYDEDDCHSHPAEINYDFIYKLLKDLKWDQYVGLEYIPSMKNTDESLKTMPERYAKYL